MREANLMSGTFLINISVVPVGTRGMIGTVPSDESLGYEHHVRCADERIMSNTLIDDLKKRADLLVMKSEV